MVYEIGFLLIPTMAFVLCAYVVWCTVQRLREAKGVYAQAQTEYTKAIETFREAAEVYAKAKKMYAEAGVYHQQASEYVKYVSVVGENFSKLWAGMVEYGGREFFDTPLGRQYIQNAQKACRELRNLDKYGDWESILVQLQRLYE